MNGALGLIETLGLVGLIHAADAMLKAANVTMASQVIKLDGGIVSVMIEATCRASARRSRRRRGGGQGRRTEGGARDPAALLRRGRRVRRGVNRDEDPRRQPGKHQLQISALRPGRPGEPLLARGSVERIGSDRAKVMIRSERGEIERIEPIADHGSAVQICLDQLTSPEFGVIASADDVAAIGFKAVHARKLTGVHRVDASVLDAMESYADVAPAHNPPYVKAMRMLHARFPKLPLVAAFETGFTRRSRTRGGDTPYPTSGRLNTASSDGGSTARATATSPAGWPRSSAATTPRSSRATSGEARRCARSRRASRSRRAWG